MILFITPDVFMFVPLLQNTHYLPVCVSTIVVYVRDPKLVISLNFNLSTRKRLLKYIDWRNV